MLYLSTNILICSYGGEKRYARYYDEIRRRANGASGRTHCRRNMGKTDGESQTFFNLAIYFRKQHFPYFARTQTREKARL